MCGDCSAMSGLGFGGVGRVRPGGWSAADPGYADRDSQRRRRQRSADGAVEWVGHGARAGIAHAARIAAKRSADDHRFALHRPSAGRASCWAGIWGVNKLTVVVVQSPASATFNIITSQRILRRANWLSNPGSSLNSVCGIASAAVSGAASHHHAGTRSDAEIRRNPEPCADRANPIVGPAYRNRCGYHVA